LELTTQEENGKKERDIILIYKHDSLSLSLSLSLSKELRKLEKKAKVNLNLKKALRYK